MKNKKGFTLIELLAVIVILAIIALIAVPIVLNMIKSARKSAAKSSALGYVDSVEYYAGFNQISGDTGISGYSVPLPTMTNGSVTCTKTTNGWNNECSAFFTAVDAKAKGDKPKTATIVISSTGKVLSGTTMKFGKYEVSYDGKDAHVTGESNFRGTIDKTKQYSLAEVEQLGLKGVVYMDPTNLKTICNKNNAVSTTGTKSGCMKFYIYDDSGSTYKMILDHNTTAHIAYETSGVYKEYEQASIKTQVDLDTAGWIGDVGLISAEEIVSVTNITDYTGEDSSGHSFYHIHNASPGDNAYAWLFDYSDDCNYFGCNIEDANVGGYWTNTIVSSHTGLAWAVSSYGGLDSLDSDVDVGDFYGIRPVITISKSQLQ